MRIRAVAPGQPRGWEVAAPSGTTVAALAAAVGLPRATHYALGGRAVAAGAALADTGAPDGALLAPLGSTTGHAPAPAVVALVAIDGPQTGTVWPLAAGEHTVGRHPSVRVFLDDPSVNGLHAELCVGPQGSISVRDRASTHGTWLGNRRLTHAAVLDHGTEVRFGATTLRVEQLDRVASPPRRHDTPHNRPPRAHASVAPEPPSEPAPVAMPTPSASVRNLIAMLVPSLAGVAIALALRPEMVALALLAPIGALATWLVIRVTDARTAARARQRERARRDEHARAVAAHQGVLARRLVARHPDLAEVACRIRRGDPRLWERRPRHDDFLRIAAGLGIMATSAPGDDRGALPVEVDLAAPIGIVGPRPRALALARSLVMQLATHHGPADVAISAWTTDPLSWQWLRWLPHVDAPAGVLYEHDAIVDAVAARASTKTPASIVVLDADGVPPRWRNAWRAMHDTAAPGATSSAIVIASNRRGLPEQCVVVIELDERGGRVDGPTAGPHVELDRVWTLAPRVAEDLAAALAPLHDPDVARRDRALVTSVSLLSLLVPGDGARDPVPLREVVLARWQQSRAAARFAAPIGVAELGALELDLVADGPHGLVAGTTGSGKSELLRSLVMSFAASVDAEHVAFVLVDYKGGSAFDGLGSLPHVVAVVTDLDAAGATRAVQGLEAEVHRRERVLRETGTADIAALHRVIADGEAHTPIPRLVIVVDEFATLAQELPAFVDALVDIAQRGRSLGVHLLLATQRPSGAVKDSIRTNTNLRIALRVLDATDSRDVIGTDDAASLARGVRGRAFIRLGADDVRAFQAAFVSGVSPAPDVQRTLRLTPLGAPVDPPCAHDALPDLARLVAAIGEAHGISGRATPMRPWADALPTDVSIAMLAEAAREHPTNASAGALTFALVDEPSTQRHGPLSWHPASGNLLVAGMAGSGTTTALCALAAATTALPIATQPHVYVIATTVAPYGWLESLPHVGAIVATSDDERVRRLLRMLAETIDARRRGDATANHPVVLLVDGIGPLRSTYDSLSGLETLDRLERVAADGPAVGVHFVFAAEHPAAVGHRIDRTIAQRVLLRLGDRAEYASAGVRDLDPASLAPGSGIDANGDRIQIARGTADELAACAARAGDGGHVHAPRVGALPAIVNDCALPAPWFTGGVFHLAVGIGDRSLAPCVLALREGDHVLVTGPPRSGMSSVLELVRARFESAGLEVVVIGTNRSGVREALVGREAIAARIEQLGTGRDPSTRIAVLVDDADSVDDGGALERLVAAHPPHIQVFAAARTDRLRGLFRHWTNEVRRSGHAVLLRPDDDAADLVGVRLPRHLGPLPVGRGWLVADGEPERCQFGYVSPRGGEPGRVA